MFKLPVHQEVTESISSLEVFYGSRAPYTLTQYVKRVLESYKGKYPKVEINSEKQKGESLSSTPFWQGLEEQALQGTGPDRLWPCE